MNRRISLADEGLNIPVLPRRGSIIPPTTPLLGLPALRITGRQKIAFIVLAILYFNSAMIVSIQAPLYPAEAVKKNATATEYSLVLGSYDLIRVIFTPIVASYIIRIGIPITFNVGVFFEGASVCAFGFLTLIQKRIEFVGISFLLRFTEAIGASGSSIAIFSLLAREFPIAVGTASGMLETVFGFGLSIGPVVGSALYTIGGFTLPFVVIAIIHFIMCIPVNILMGTSKYNEMNDDDDDHNNTSLIESTENEEQFNAKYKLINFIKIPSIIFFPFCMFVAGINIGFRTALQEPYLSQFNLSKAYVGLTFLLNAGTYAIFSVIIVLIIRRSSSSGIAIYFTLAGSAISAFAFAIFGPATFVPLIPTVTLALISLVIQGIGQAAVFISIYNLTYEESKIHGFTDVAHTSAFVSSLILTSCSIGICFGSGTAGILYDHLGFYNASLCIVILNVILTVMMLFFIHFRQQIRNLNLNIRNSSSHE